MAPTSEPGDKKKSFEDQWKAKVAELVKEATDSDFEWVERVTASGYFEAKGRVTPVRAALLLDRNTHNRRISEAQVGTLSGILMRHEWKATHQGMAFYADGTLMDAQHRLIACVMSGIDLDPIMISTGYDKDDNDAIDAGVRRTAADAAGLAGVGEAAIKCQITDGWLKYKHQLEYGTKINLTNHQVKVKAVEFNKQLSSALAMADAVLKNCSIAPMSKKEIAARAFESVSAGWSPTYVTVLLTLICQGTADYDGAPTVFLSEAYQKDKDEKSKFKLTALERQAMFFKVAGLYAQKKRVAKSAIHWKSGTPLPPMAPPSDGTEPEPQPIAAE